MKQFDLWGGTKDITLPEPKPIPRPAPPPESAPTYYVTYPEAYDLMLDALQNEADPWEAEMVFQERRVPLYACTEAGDFKWKLSEALYLAQIEREFELEAERQRVVEETVFTDDWSL